MLEQVFSGIKKIAPKLKIYVEFREGALAPKIDGRLIFAFGIVIAIAFNPSCKSAILNDP